MRSIYDIFVHNCNRYPSKNAVIFNDEAWTYKDLWFEINRMSHGLHQLGIKQGTKVSLVMKNSTTFIVTFFALVKLGAYLSPLNYRITAEEIAYTLGTIGCEFLIIGRGFEDFTLPEKADSSATIKLIYENKAARFESLKSIANNGQSDWDFQAIIDSDAAALNIFTSGTTGPSKTAVHTQGGLFLTTVTMLTDETLFDSSTVYLNYAPLFHFGGMNAMLQTLGIGGTLVLTEDFRPESMLGIIEREKVSNLMVLPPSLCLRFYEECSKREYDLASVKVIILAGGVCTQEIAEYTFSLFRNACMFNGYSQSENAVRMALKLTREEYKNEPNLINSVGVPSAWCEVRLVDENGVDVDRGECGEVWGRSPYMLDHYLEGDAFVDGWFQTGDLMRQDTNGRFYFMGRVKDMIKSGGENVYACEVEETIMKSGLIQEVAVVGLPDKYLNEIVVAVAVLTPNAVFSENDVIEWCKENMASYKKPRRVYFVDALPLEVTGKLSKTKLRTLLLESM